jgi:alpha-L-arabinofuranosidase
MTMGLKKKYFLKPCIGLLLVDLLISPLAASAANPSKLVNGGFESPEVLTAWGRWIYQDGRTPRLRADTSERAEDRQSLLIEAQDPADVALGQVVDLPAGSLWRVKAMMKCEQLVARTPTDTGGAVHVQTPGGATLARGPSTFGTSPWKALQVIFRVPSDGKVKVVLFFVGYGKGTGKVWFDDVQLEPIRTQGPEHIRITDDRLSRRPIDAKQAGQFIEPLCNLIPSLVAQQVANTSFEIDPPWNVAFRREIDKLHRPWYPDGAVHLARYSYDTNQPFNGTRSLRIELTAPHARAGISQDGFHLNKGTGYRLRLHARSLGPVTVQATLHGGGGLAAAPASLGQPGPDWAPAETILRATCTMENATLTIDFEGSGTLWLDRVYLISEDAVLGLWRPDVVQALRELSPGVIRFGGSALETYEWDQCLGSWDQRAPFVQTYWGGIEENLVGVEEFVQLCQAVNAEPLVCLRWTGKKPADAAAEVEYFNGSVRTPMGQRRAQNGHPKPYGVKYWQIGNEVGGATYDASVRAFAAAMRDADASIKVLSSFPSADTLQAGGGYLDYLCPHHYDCADLAGEERDFLWLEERIRLAGATRSVRVAVTEWNTTAAGWELGRATLQTLANGLAVSCYHNLMHRHADSVEIAIRSNLIDSFGSGAILTGPGWIYFSPAYYAQSLYTRAAGSYPLRIDRDAGVPGLEMPWHLGEPNLSAALSADGQTLRLYGVNLTGQPLTLATTLSGIGSVASGGTIRVMRDSRPAHTPEVLNTRDDPERVKVFTAKTSFRGTEFVLRFDPFGLTLYELPLHGPRR